ncbi:MAG: PEP-CTERM sorting domain-containing protein [Phycisphaerae bacterium]
MNDSQGSFTVENPFLASQFASVGVSTAATNYDIAWSESSGAFLIDGAHQTEDVSSSTLFSRSSGGIIMSASQDLTINLDASYTYSAPSVGFFVRLSISIINLDQSEIVFDDNVDGGPHVLGPPNGTLVIQGDALLPAGSTYTISYQMRLQSFAGGSNAIATGDGHVNMLIETVPEPSTLSLLVIGLLVTRRRRGHHAGLQRHG